MAEMTTLARPYAKAAFESAQAADALAGWGDMLGLAAAIAEDETVEERVIDNPLVTPEAAADFFLEVGGDRFTDDFANLLRLMAENRRLGLLPGVSRLFAFYRAEAEKTLEVWVTAAVEPPADFSDRLATALGKRFGRDVTVAVDVNETLLGGALIRAGDTVIDGTLRSKLDKMANDIRR